MAEAGIKTIMELSRRTGLSRPTLTAMADNTGTQVLLSTLGRVAEVLGQKSPGDLIVWNERSNQPDAKGDSE
jgi:DNA-binding Xre family transcriptional regulator